MISDEYSLRCHEMAKELMREFRVVQYVGRLHKYPDARIKEYAKYYQQAYALFYSLGIRETSE